MYTLFASFGDKNAEKGDPKTLKKKTDLQNRPENVTQLHAGSPRPDPCGSLKRFPEWEDWQTGRPTGH